MNKENLYTQLKSLLIAMLELDEEKAKEINEKTKLIDNLGMSSVEALEFLVLIEKEYSIIIEDEDLDSDLFKDIKTLGEYLEKRLF
ncbi:phosphopantetheine-binding protein [Cytobacillus kochii]|uniref:acyl carrier protein n=1 Tax=Cytobacillus kochii TaxID=859143 RepID=UPI001CD7186D|nr:phosphopantetheine-binding protein [Cytobacillus kochii]MCA1028641.1 phosphopantetheine-binding protein [Cytobacillus kochii]